MTTKKKSPDAKVGGGARTPRVSETYEAALRTFEEGIAAFHGGDYKLASSKFQVVEAADRDETVLVGRARTYLAVCERRMAPAATTPKSREDYYRYGVAMANEGKIDEALASLDCAVDMGADADSYYARAVVRGLQGKADLAASDLRKAIERDPQLRYQAANDPDFDSVRDEAVFIDIIEPTPTGA